MTTEVWPCTRGMSMPVGLHEFGGEGVCRFCGKPSDWERRVQEAEQRGAVKALREAAEEIRSAPSVNSAVLWLIVTAALIESEPDDPPATRDMDPMWGRDTEGAGDE